MRFVSLCTIGAALLPMVSAAPCKPSSPTSVLSATTTAESETLTTTTATETDFHSTVTSDATSVLETTITETATWSETTTFVSDYTTEYSATTDATSIEDFTTTITEIPEPTNLIRNGGFEDAKNVDWDTRTGGIESNPDKANSGDKYATFELVNADGSGGNTLNQTINALDTDRRYRLAFSAAVFDDPAIVLGESTCVIEALQKQTVIDSWTPNFAALNQYKEYETTFSLIDEDLSLSLRLRCNGRNKVTFSMSIDDVSLYDAGPVPDQVVTITE
ncbi:hypothetical protein HYE67_002216 [Fusarium culmorum]|uniref:CBM-cenC domain-containing protein n=1 Tax=Fusarium culmorum TaxID=5516 RepID=A0A2T4GW34_FUSCU|nr:hypothetical protein FCULG_00006426 [Fusarium culmorum]QPC59985.1 hypothetical protein HYE67_002216 [Fusarium culmorum]